jgi:parallel beta-helix repeat protein
MRRAVILIVLAIISLIGILTAYQILSNENGPVGVTAPVGTAVQVNPGDDLDAKVNSAPSGAVIRVHGKASATPYFYTVDDAIELKDGQRLVGDSPSGVGSTSGFGPAVVQAPVVGLKKASGVYLSTLIRADGNPITISWLDVNATGAEKGITTEMAGPGLSMDHLRVHGAGGPGIGQAQGVLTDSELFGNGMNAATVGATAAGIKCIVACEVAHTYAHDNGGNGIWCDVGCATVDERAKGVWFHDNVTEGNTRFGIRYENSPKPDLNPNDPVSALIEGNLSYGNTEGGVEVADAENATVRNNTFGETPGRTIIHNERNFAITLRDSDEPDRGTQQNATVTGNTLSGEVITGCGLRGNVCTDNS